MEAVTLVPPLEVLESVHCLDCGEIYSKPVAGGTVLKNPGCPACGYVGWIPISLPPERGPWRRSAAGRPLLPLQPTR
jgi:hypothetical protein